MVVREPDNTYTVVIGNPPNQHRVFNGNRAAAHRFAAKVPVFESQAHLDAWVASLTPQRKAKA